MKREDIIRMARSAFDVHTDERGRETFSGDHFCVEELVALVAAERDALRHRVRELEEAMRMCGIDHSTLLKVAAAIRGRPL